MSRLSRNLIMTTMVTGTVTRLTLVTLMRIKPLAVTRYVINAGMFKAWALSGLPTMARFSASEA